MIAYEVWDPRDPEERRVIWSDSERHSMAAREWFDPIVSEAAHDDGLDLVCCVRRAGYPIKSFRYQRTVSFREVETTTR